MQPAQLLAALPITKAKAAIDCKKNWTDIFHPDARLTLYTDKSIIDIFRYGKDKYYMHIANSHNNSTLTLKAMTKKLATLNIEVIKVYNKGVCTTYMRRSK